MFVVVFGGVRACVYQLAGALFFFIIFKKKILYMVTFYCNHTRALTFQIFFLAAVEISRPLPPKSLVSIVITLGR